MAFLTRQKAKGALLYLAFLTIFIIITMEIFFRFYIGGETHTVGGPAFRIDDAKMNGYFMRDTDMPDAGKFTILALGDSFTYGHGIKDWQKSWPQQLEHSINSSSIAVVNAGLPGLNTPDELILFDVVGKEYTPEVVIIGYSINDAVTDESYEGTELVYNTYIKKVRQPWAMDRYNEAKAKYAPGLEEYKIKGFYGKAGSFLFTKSYLWYFLVTRITPQFRKATFADNYESELASKFSTSNISRHLNDLKALTDEIKNSGAEPVIVIIPYPIHLENYPFNSAHEMIRKFADENGVIVIDPLPEFVGKDATKLQVNKYDLHLNEEGNRILSCYVHGKLAEERIIPAAGSNISGC